MRIESSVNVSIIQANQEREKLTFGDLKDDEVFLCREEWCLCIKEDGIAKRALANRKSGYFNCSESEDPIPGITDDTLVRRVTNIEYTVEDYK